MNRPLVMEPEDEIRLLKAEVAQLRKALETSTRLLCLLNRPGACDPIEAAVFAADAALNPAKSAAPFSPG